VLSVTSCDAVCQRWIIPPAVLILKEKVSAQAVLGSVIAVAGSALLFL
jgi:drug/metabolite transporter (DMT)-like permease